MTQDYESHVSVSAQQQSLSEQSHSHHALERSTAGSRRLDTSRRTAPASRLSRSCCGRAAAFTLGREREPAVVIIITIVIIAIIAITIITDITGDHSQLIVATVLLAVALLLLLLLVVLLGRDRDLGRLTLRGSNVISGRRGGYDRVQERDEEYRVFTFGRA